MFTLEQINEEVEKFNKYTSYNIPDFHGIEHTTSGAYLGEVKNSEIMNNNYIIHISNKLYDSPLEFQKSVIWHESTHLYDALQCQKYQENILHGLMSTYSEAHAESIQLRYLLHITPKQIVNQGKRYLIYKNGKEDLGLITSGFINSSIQALNNLRTSKSPNDFNSFINFFCYFCGYMMLKKRNDADKLSLYVITKYPKYNTELQALYKSIMGKDFVTASNIYNIIKSEETISSFENIF